MTDNTGRFEPTWESLQAYRVPEWYRKAKLGIFIHWGVYSVPAFGDEWYPRLMYQRDTTTFFGQSVYQYHRDNYGPQDQFGYKDFIPMFRAEDWQPEAWAELFAEAGAQYVVPVAEHHDGFAMYDSAYTPWNAAQMGPKRDVIAELAKAARKQGLKFGVSTHRGWNWQYYTYENEFDTTNPQYSGLYSPRHPADTPAPVEWMDDWFVRTVELMDKFQPDLMYFDFGWHHDEFAPYRPRILSSYYNRALEWGKEVVLNHKGPIPEGTAVLDLERSKLDHIREEYWQTDTSVSFLSWGYIQNDALKTVTSLVHELIDVVSKNGNLLINVGPKSNGVVPEAQANLLRGLGRWLKTNGEAIYGTVPWHTHAERQFALLEGETAEVLGHPFTEKDVRYTSKGNVLYALMPRWPGERITLPALSTESTAETRQIRSAHMLGLEGALSWSQNEDGLTVDIPNTKPCDHAYVIKIELG